MNSRLLLQHMQLSSPLGLLLVSRMSLRTPFVHIAQSLIMCPGSLCSCFLRSSVPAAGPCASGGRINSHAMHRTKERQGDLCRCRRRSVSTDTEGCGLRRRDQEKPRTEEESLCLRKSKKLSDNSYTSKGSDTGIEPWGRVEWASPRNISKGSAQAMEGRKDGALRKEEPSGTCHNEVDLSQALALCWEVKTLCFSLKTDNQWSLQFLIVQITGCEGP